MFDRVKHAFALTPAEERRLENIKETLRHLAEAPVAKQVVDWMKTLPGVDPDRQYAVYERPEGQRAETP